MNIRETSQNNQLQQAAPEVVKASACPADWDKMTGNDRVRYCENCKHFVYNAAGLKTADLLGLIWFREGTRPLRLYRRADGTLMTSDCAVGLRKTRLIYGFAAGSALSLITLFCLSFSAPHPAQTASVTPAAAAPQITAAFAPVLAQPANVAPAQPVTLPVQSTRSAAADTVAKMGSPVASPAQPEAQLEQVPPAPQSQASQPAGEQACITPLNQPQSIQSQIQPGNSQVAAVAGYETTEQIASGAVAAEHEKPQYVWTAPSVAR